MDMIEVEAVHVAGRKFYCRKIMAMDFRAFPLKQRIKAVRFQEAQIKSGQLEIVEKDNKLYFKDDL